MAIWYDCDGVNDTMMMVVMMVVVIMTTTIILMVRDCDYDGWLFKDKIIPI